MQQLRAHVLEVCFVWGNVGLTGLANSHSHHATGTAMAVCDCWGYSCACRVKMDLALVVAHLQDGGIFGKQVK